ncbi:MAG TPA: hypothetical protein VMI53_10825 [Opitutaceae bacterium]|nr:hypothetical protein [Opitutaceae bacterium]
MPLLPADTPRLPKWPFLAGDAALLILAGLVIFHARNPFGGTPLVVIVACVALGAILATIPFVTDYARKQDEAFDERQRALEALARTVATSAEQIGIATIGLHGVAENATKSAKLVEQIPAQLQEKIDGLKQRPAETPAAKTRPAAPDPALGTESARLETTADHIRQAAAELARLETAAQKNLAAARAELDAKAGQVLSQLDAKISALAALVEKLPAPVRPVPMETNAPFRFSPAEKIEAPADDPAPALSDPAEKPADPAPPEEPKMPRKRTPKKPKTEEVEPSLGLAAAAENTVPASPGPPAVHEPAAAGEFSQSSPDEAAPVSALSADGATRLLVTAYIGIGNRLFLRGEGPGLSWDKGVPLSFVSIGKWRWETSDATAAVRAKLYKNDEIECDALGTLTVEPGQQAEVTAAF